MIFIRTIFFNDRLINITEVEEEEDIISPVSGQTNRILNSYINHAFYLKCPMVELL